MLAQLLTMNDKSGKPNVKTMKKTAEVLGVSNLSFSNTFQRLCAKKEGNRVIITISDGK